MPKLISYDTKELIQKLYKKGLTIAEIARRTNVPYATVYGHTRVRQRINPETGKTFKSRTEYQNYQVRQRSQRKENKELSDLIKRRLSELGKNQSWLAEEIGVTRQAASLYIKGKNIPSKDLLSKLYSVLEVPYQTLDNLLK